MKKNKRGIYFIIGILLIIVLLVVYTLLKKQNDVSTEEAEEEATSENLLDINADDVTSMSFLTDQGESTWLREDDTWTYMEDENFPADNSTLDSSLSLLTNASITRTLSDVEDLSEYGLSDPQNIIKLETADKTAVIYVGDENTQTGDTYVYKDDNTKTIYTVDFDFSSYFSSSLYDYAVGESYPSIGSSYMTAVDVEKSTDSYSLISNGESFTNWYVADEKGQLKEADSTQAETVLSTISGLSFAGYYEYDCEDWSLYGLDEPKYTITVDYFELITSDDDSDESSDDSDDTEEEIQTEDKILTIQIGNLSDDGNYYVRIDDSSEVHGISQTALESILSAKAFDYRNTSISCLGRNHLDHLDITYNGKTYTLSCEETEEEVENTEEDSDEETKTTTVTTYYVDGQQVDESLFVNFYTIIATMSYQSLLEENDTAGGAEFTLAFYSKDEDYHDVKVTYTQRDSSFYVAADQDDNYGLVNKQNVKNMIEAFVQLINSME